MNNILHLTFRVLISFSGKMGKKLVNSKIAVTIYYDFEN